VWHRQGIRVGVLSGPGYCTKSRHRRTHKNASRAASSSSLADNSHGDNSAAAGPVRDSSFRLNMPIQVGYTSNVCRSHLIRLLTVAVVAAFTLVLMLAISLGFNDAFVFIFINDLKTLLTSCILKWHSVTFKQLLTHSPPSGFLFKTDTIHWH